MTQVSPYRVAIKTFPVQEDDLIKDTEISRDQAMKKQNRGQVILVGSKCDPWLSSGDTVSFYRNASTPVKNDDCEEYEIVHEDHILAKF